MSSNKGIWKIIAASSVGTLIEWYDFYIFGSLAIIISEKFFPSENPTTAFLATLATFAAGFIVRPFGALFFGRLGDLIGRKHTFLLTLIIMGGGTFLIGCIPSYQSFHLAPYVILLLRLLQGLALGGEYGGAATYVAEHAPAHKRGYYTSWIQTTATLGLFISLIVIITIQSSLSKEAFNNWGWRLPFLLSIILVIVSIIIRMKMSESPLFAKLKTEGKISKNPLKESFGKKQNLKMVLLALFGATMGQGVVWYTSQFYTQTFLLKTCGLDSTQTNTWLGIALLIATPFFIFFGWLSDKTGRKIIMMSGLLLAIIFYRPIFSALYDLTNIKNKQEISSVIDVKKIIHPSIAHDSLIIKTTQVVYNDNSKMIVEEKYTESVVKAGNNKPQEFKKIVTLSNAYKWKIIGLIFILVLFVTMVYGPIAAFLVELFPTKIRYTSMSLPYHIGNGVFGGLVPFTVTLISTMPGSNYLSGLWYPIGVAIICFIIGILYLSNKNNELSEEENFSNN
ncbi:MAG: MFS transporter [Chitinophagaceae bacterium]|nr:MFS transporter [Chitinophagaceae bacterium]MCW5904978.1 MFS transporter [Chitinophagaceae bacterium]